MDEQTIIATVESIVFRNDDNGYTVAEVSQGDELLTLVGTLPSLREGQRVEAAGVWKTHATYGKQLQVEACRTLPPDSLEGLVRYLASGVLPGVGEVTAQRIVERFGLDALNVLRHDPGRIQEVEGIGAARAQTIAAGMAQQQQMQDVMIFLQSLRIPMGLAGRIYKAYGPLTQGILERDPYRLVTEVEGVGFRTADRIASSLGVEAGAPSRIQAGLRYLMQEAVEARGHTCLPQELLLQGAVQILDAPEEAVAAELMDLLKARKLVLREVEGRYMVYLPSYLAAENEVAQRLTLLAREEVVVPFHSVEEAVDMAASLASIRLADEQKQAVQAALCQGLTAITGGPGTGKTTAIRCILAVLEQAGLSVELAAPTGRAAKRMGEATGREARTLHRLLEYGFSSEEDQLSFGRDEDNPLACDALVVDEASMIDLMLMQRLLRALSPGCRLILVGDVDQLPPVGAGDVLRAVLESGVTPAVRLKTIFRQAEQSLIVVNAHRVNRGEMPDLSVKNRDFFFERKADNESAYQAVEALVMRRIPGFLHCDRVRDIQVLCPMKKGDLGVAALNLRLQQALNPPDPARREAQFGGQTFREGDKVMQVRNNYQQAWRRVGDLGLEEGKGVFNGDVGYIQTVNREAKQVTVLFEDGRAADIAFEDMLDLTLAYAVSIHKSQGSEFPVVILPLLSGPPMLMTRNLLYTAITRARQMVMVVGSERTVARMVENDTVVQRYSGLLSTLRAFAQEEA